MKPTPKARRIVLRMEAYTDPAGKYDATAPQNGNEDNFFVSDHGDATGMVVEPPHGVLIAVADGMGGLNAGEVASDMAINTVTEYFTPEKIAAMASHNGPTRQMYLERIIRQADARIKAAQRSNPAQANMGSTIVLAWLMDNELVVSWCGDSRAYIYNAAGGLRLISHDHSYVQELVDRGAITYDQAFDHPQNNIVTRSLGDPQHDAKPDSVRLTMSKGDILLVCSDGLTGVLRDKKAYDDKHNLLPEMNMEDIFRAATTLKECREMLWDAASKSGWYDNVTAVLCEMVEEPQAAVTVAPQPAVASSVVETPVSNSVSMSMATPQHTRSKSWIWVILAALCIAVVLGLLAWFIWPDKAEPKQAELPDTEEEIILNQDEDEEAVTDNVPAAAEEDVDHEHKTTPAESPANDKNTKKEDKRTGTPLPSAKPTTEEQKQQAVPQEKTPEKEAEHKGWQVKKKGKPNNQPSKPDEKLLNHGENSKTN